MNGICSELPGGIHGRAVSVGTDACATATGRMRVTGAVAKVGGKS